MLRVSMHVSWCKPSVVTKNLSSISHPEPGGVYAVLYCTVHCTGGNYSQMYCAVLVETTQ